MKHRRINERRRRIAIPQGLALARHIGLAGGVLLMSASNARAFSDQDRFADQAAKGGGGGRYFTGSPADGFGCAVCHRGASAPKVEVRGLPDDFLAGTTYDVELAWDNPALTHGIALELVTGENLAAGTIALPVDAAITAAERCKSQPSERPAAELHTENGRQVLTVENCGSSIVRFRWTAPQANDVTFAAGVVRSDASATAQGDGVAEISRALLPVGATRNAGGGCHVGRSRGPWLSLLALLIPLSLRRRRRP